MGGDLSTQDAGILRSLAAEQAQIAALPVHREKAELWRRLNDLEPVRPMVWINEVCWHEMNVADELTLQAVSPWARDLERGLRRLLYQWRHFPADMIVDDYLSCPLVIHNTGFGISEEVDIARTDEASDVVSRHFHRQIVEPEDIEKLHNPVIRADQAATDANYERMVALFKDILPVKKVGIKGSWFAPWDELIRWWGVEDAMTDLVDRPEMVHAIMARLVDAYLCMLDQWEALGLLTSNNDNTRIGSGGYGYTTGLPGPDQSGVNLAGQPAKNLWGCATAQIFSDVSPRMHWEFALQYELRWLERWGLTYYGCCEPLDRKIEILRRIPNLRKISASPWNQIERLVNQVGHNYVLSRKPNPAILARDAWQPDLARQELQEFLDHTQGLSVEIILKDISTVRHDPRRLWAWEKMAMETVESIR